MNNAKATLPRLLFFAAVVTVLTAARPQASIGEIRMCAAAVETKTCPIDNPVFERTTTGIYINVDATELAVGDRMRFTWYYLPTDGFFSDYLGSVNETVAANNIEDNGVNVMSTFPKGVPVKPGNYEVVVHPPDGSRPIIKTFKVLD